MPVDLTDVMVRQQTVAGGRAILHQRGDFPRLVDESHMAGAVFVHSDGALEGSREETNGKRKCRYKTKKC